MIRGRADIRCPLCLTCTDIWNSTSGPTSQPTNQPQIAIQKASRKFILRISGTKWHKFFFLDKRNRLVLHFVKSKSTWNFETRVNQDHLHSVIQFALERTEPGKTSACITTKEKKVREKLKTTSDLWGRQGCRGQVGAPVDFPLLWIRPTHAQQNIHTQTIFDQLIFLKSDFTKILHLRQGIILKDDIHKRFLWQWKPRVLGTVCVFLETGRNRLLPRVSGGRGGEMSFDQIWQLGLQCLIRSDSWGSNDQHRTTEGSRKGEIWRGREMWTVIYRETWKRSFFDQICWLGLGTSRACLTVRILTQYSWGTK